MDEPFDPYYKWLGIPPEEQPPNHYRLLAVRPLESDGDVIESAADARMAHLRTYQAGKHSALSQKLLNEVASAKVCLLNPDKKAQYDAQLKGRLTAGAAESLGSTSVAAASGAADGAFNLDRLGLGDEAAAGGTGHSAVGSRSGVRGRQVAMTAQELGGGWKLPVPAWAVALGVCAIGILALIVVLKVAPRRDGGEAGATGSEPPAPLPVAGPAYSPQGELVPVELGDKANARLIDAINDGSPVANLARLGRGDQAFCGVKFKIGDSYIQLAGSRLPDKPKGVEGIRIDGYAGKLYFLHAVAYARDVAPGRSLGQ